jgi:hypothetical protein
MAIGLWVTWHPRPDVAASYAVSVRRAGTLPAASFRFRVTPDTLAVRLTVPTIRVRRGLSPPSHRLDTTSNRAVLTHHAPCLAHQRKTATHMMSDRLRKTLCCNQSGRPDSNRRPPEPHYVSIYAISWDVAPLGRFKYLSARQVTASGSPHPQSHNFRLDPHPQSHNFRLD